MSPYTRFWLAVRFGFGPIPEGSIIGDQKSLRNQLRALQSIVDRCRSLSVVGDKISVGRTAQSLIRSTVRYKERTKSLTIVHNPLNHDRR